MGSDAVRNMQMVRDQFVDKAKGFLRGVPMASEIVALYFCMLDSKTPMWVKGAAAAALAYFILPIDAVPDMLPIVGLSDDLSVLSAALAALSSYITEEHRERARMAKGRARGGCRGGGSRVLNPAGARKRPAKPPTANLGGRIFSTFPSAKTSSTVEFPVILEAVLWSNGAGALCQRKASVRVLPVE